MRQSIVVPKIISIFAACQHLAKIVIRKEDRVNIYPLCTECFARIEYIPPIRKVSAKIEVV